MTALKNNLTVSHADMQELPQILRIYECARGFMKESGNESQWKDSFPPESLLIEDISAGQLYVLKDLRDGVIHGVFAFIVGKEPTYERIEQGGWISGTAYGTLHRVAGDGTVHGIFDAIVAFCEERISHLRVDTHEDNRIMQHLISKNGFQRCGIIYVEDGSPRIAYEKTAEAEGKVGRNNMNTLTEKDKELIVQAQKAIRSNYDEVSYNHTVGAAVRCGSGKVYTGVNVYSLHGACGEQVAIGTAITQGEREFETIVAVRGREGEEIIPPCGNCRQMLFDYMPECEVILAVNGQRKKVRAKELLPFAYSVEG